METILNSPYDYQLYRKDGKLWLSVECGRSAVFTVSFPLNDEEAKEYERGGQTAISRLADYVRSDPDHYFERGKQGK